MKYDTRLFFRETLETVKKIKKVAKKKGVKQSEWIRTALREKLNQEIK